ncbi:MAG: SDR family oxidoreductase [Acidimicrobiia bacterium]|nr:SDR family oxidoreductase [Acidimicrobiia bacterium]MDX2468752.1 SDR family oxidoreductase [Acidimicrobiia bacterium]
MDSQHLPSFRLSGQVAVVTGANRGIGRGLAEALAAAGATVAVTARSVAAAEQVATELRSAGGSATGHGIDVADIASIRAGISSVMDQHQRIDILVANAGLGANHPALDVDEASWDEMMDVNLKGLFFTAQACGKHMVAQGSGRIVAVSSQASLVAIRDHAVYCASKGGVNQLVRVMALEWGPFGVTVNAVAPTFIYTPGTADRLDDPAYLATVVDRIPVGHVGQIKDVAGAVVYLASEAGAMVNGSIVAVDGGWTAQ